MTKDELARCEVCNCELVYSGLSPSEAELYECPLCKANERIRELERLVAELETQNRALKIAVVIIGFLVDAIRNSAPAPEKADNDNE